MLDLVTVGGRIHLPVEFSALSAVPVPFAGSVGTWATCVHKTSISVSGER